MSDVLVSDTESRRGEELEIHGDGRQTRSFAYVDDLIDGIVERTGTRDAARAGVIHDNGTYRNRSACLAYPEKSPDFTGIPWPAPCLAARGS